MSVKVTTDTFINRANVIHNYFYDYSESVYKKSQEKVRIKCPIHGIFLQKPNGHLNGRGCPKCANSNRVKRLDQKEFIFRCKRIHENKYDYSSSVYKNWNSKIEIKCPIHGIFKQRAGDHINGEGCRKCANGKMSLLSKIPLKEFIIRCKRIHKNKYDYSHTIYINNRTKIKILCRKHGEFFINPDNHLRGYGCKKCNRENQRLFYLKEIIKKSKKRHDNFYKYPPILNIYNKKIKIECPIHGVFKQEPYYHYKGGGCPYCYCKEEYKTGLIIEKIFKGWKIEKRKRIFSKEHERNRYFDFYLSKNKIKVIIEYDGKQHYEPVRFSKKMSVEEAQKKFIKQTNTDELDSVFCKNNEIYLFRVSYLDNKQKTIEKILEQLKGLTR